MFEAQATRLAVAEATLRRQVTVPLRFPDGYATSARVMTFDGLADGKEHLALGLGDWQRALTKSAAGGRAPLVRPHSECLTGDVFGSQRCDCGPQLREAVERIADQGGFLLYLRQEGRGIGLYAKLDAYALQDDGLDTYQANLALGREEDERDYTAAARGGPDPPAQQQPGQGRATHRSGHRRHAADPDRGAPVRGQRALPQREGVAHRPHHRTPPGRVTFGAF
jgi:GTP cyclohydrolase II